MTAQAARVRPMPAVPGDERAAIISLCRRSSIELSVHDLPKLPECRAFLPCGLQLYISHLPGQPWQQTIEAAAQVRAHGFDPVPHLPVRKLTSEGELQQVLKGLSGEAAVKQVLLIAGDVKEPHGPFAATIEVMQSGLLAPFGITSLSIAGHPEGHPAVAETEIRAAEAAKAELANQLGIELTFVTQFLFESAPIIDWCHQLRGRGVHGMITIGLAGPAKLTTLLNYAMRCGVGPSIRAIGSRGSALTRLIGERGPERIVRDLARAYLAGDLDIDGLHLYSFGGLMRTCRWFRAVADGRFDLDDDGGFSLTSAN
jgi:methylenetetrahydrofolate reductase (NADPH)